MAVTVDPPPDEAQPVTFWFGCNMLRHGEIIRLSVEILSRLGIVADPVGGLNYCCGATKDNNPTASGGMSRRTASRLNEKGPKVVTWCPSCHIQLDDVVSRTNDLTFDYSHIAGVLHERREQLRPLLVHAVERKGVLHCHSGFERRTPVNGYVADLLAMIPGYQVSAGRLSPGHMCAPLAAVPQALRDVVQGAVDDAESAQADDVVTIFHSCHRDMVVIDRTGKARVVNYVHLLAESMGIPYVDEYKAWRNADDPAAAVGGETVGRLGADAFSRTVLPELSKKSPIE